jgi:hypothetical protein
MNDLPQNELFSAYLDGELSAGEQAEVERLLASSPAARQLLDELRAVSATLQSLPRRKLGENISQQVLRMAERRMLTEGEPGDTAAAPLSRPLFRRFINRRSMVWLGLTVAVAVMIAIQEQQEKNALVNKAGKAVAVAQGDHDKLPKGAADDSFRPTTMQADRGAVARDAVKKREATGLTVGKKPGKAPEPEKLAMTPNATESLKPGGGADSSRLPPSKQTPALDAPAAPASAAPLASTSAPSSRGHIGNAVAAASKAAGYGARKAGPGGSSNWYDGDASTSLGPDVLLVFCDVSAEATKKKALDKVLAANGIISRVHVEAKDKAQELGSRNGYVGKSKADGKGVLAKHLPSGVVRRKAVVGEAELVYVEATPLQVKATLASLSAQPNVFVSVSVKSSQDAAARQLLRYFATSGEELQRKSGLSGIAGKAEGGDQRQNQSNPPTTTGAKSANAVAANRSGPAAPQHEDGQTAGGRSERQCDEKKADASREPALAQSEEAEVEKKQGTEVAQRPNAAGSLAGESPPAGAKSASPRPSEQGSQSKPGVVAQQTVPAAEGDGGAEVAQLQQAGQPAASPSGPRPAPRQRVLFVVRIGGGAPPAASQVGGQPGDNAKQPAAAVPADPVPPK